MITDKTPKLYLSRRNLLALLSKLDRDAAGEETACTLIKHQQPSPAYQQTMKEIAVIAVQDEDYYGAQERPAGEVHPADEAKLTPPSTGITYGGSHGFSTC
jgi:hypothetical protein